MTIAPGIFYEYKCSRADSLIRVCPIPREGRGSTLEPAQYRTNRGHRDGARNAFPGHPPAAINPCGCREEDLGLPHLGACSFPVQAKINGASGDHAMTTHTPRTDTTTTGRAAHHDRDGFLCRARATPHRMPAGGWIRDVATSENWRTTTIVQRHRDRATPMPSS